MRGKKNQWPSNSFKPYRIILIRYYRIIPIRHYCIIPIYGKLKFRKWLQSMNYLMMRTTQLLNTYHFTFFTKYHNFVTFFPQSYGSVVRSRYKKATIWTHCQAIDEVMMTLQKTFSPHLLQHREISLRIYSGFTLTHQLTY
jgi:hypothetical protein